MTYSRRDSWFRTEGRKGKYARSESTRQPGRLAPADPIKPYEYGASVPSSRPDVPDERKSPKPQVAPEPTVERMPTVKHRMTRAVRPNRLRQRGRKVKLLLVRPTRRSVDDPTLMEQLTYIPTVVADMRLDLEHQGRVDERDALTLLRLAEDVYARASGVEVVEDDVA
ncbi:hypothetical protein [Streptomyces sp. NPDC059080]|uniref:hypothetical protein n=1 Tax=Streptomyces sp. NPDC059080 TaxID=3346718 RepID=UPI0036815688